MTLSEINQITEQGPESEARRFGGGALLWQRAIRLARNLWLDIRFGGRFLGGTVPTRYGQYGAHDTANSDYQALAHIFARIPLQPEDVLVDVGCGKGRVLNWCLEWGFRCRLIGLELDPDIAHQTATRLRRYSNVTLIAGNALEHLPADGNIFYLFNPFGESVLRTFRSILEARSLENRNITVVYYNCVHLAVFKETSCWFIEELQRPPHSGFHPAAILRLKPLKSEITEAALDSAKPPQCD